MRLQTAPTVGWMCIFIFKIYHNKRRDIISAFIILTQDIIVIGSLLNVFLHPFETLPLSSTVVFSSFIFTTPDTFVTCIS